MDDITENFVPECLIKVQTFFESMCGKKLGGWMAKIYRTKILMECTVTTHKQPLSKVSACCRCLLPS